jgi:hypothetical protein
MLYGESTLRNTAFPQGVMHFRIKGKRLKGKRDEIRFGPIHPNVFLSHASEEKPYVRTVARRLDLLELTGLRGLA